MLCGVSDGDGRGYGADRGIAQGQFQTRAIMANFTQEQDQADGGAGQQHLSDGTSGMSVVFLDQTTMVFGDKSR